MSEIQKGDVVRLKSGGPDMTVQALGDYPSSGIKDGVYCVWFEKTKQYKEVFDRAVLVRASEIKS